MIIRDYPFRTYYETERFGFVQFSQSFHLFSFSFYIQDAAKYRDELKEIAPHCLLKCSSDATTLVWLIAVFVFNFRVLTAVYFFIYLSFKQAIHGYTWWSTTGGGGRETGSHGLNLGVGWKNPPLFQLC